MKNIENSTNRRYTSLEDVLLENEALEARNEFLERCVEALKLNNAEITIERNEALDKLHAIQQMSMFEFGSKYCNDEQNAADGRAFAKALLGGK